MTVVLVAIGGALVGAVVGGLAAIYYVFKDTFLK